jgi:hypothetical protein
MMNPQKQITTNAPSIRYEGDLRAEQAGIMQKHAQAMQQMQQQNMMQQQQQQQGMMQPQMGQPQMPQDPRQMAAYGGIMGVDGRKQYGIGSWFQEKIMDPIKNNPSDSCSSSWSFMSIYFDYTGGQGRIKVSKNGLEVFGNTQLLNRDYKKHEAEIETGTGKTVSSDIMGGLSKALIPAAGGLVAGMFSDKLNPADEQGNIDYGSGIGLSNIAKSANLLDQKQGIQAGLRFLPKVSARQYTPEEMAVQYSSTPATLAGGGIAELGIPDYGQQMMDPNMMEQIRMMVESMQAQGMGREEMEQAVRMQVPDMSADMSMGYAEGGPLGEMGTVMEEGEEMLDMNGMEKDYREEGGFVPIGEYEKKDDVPARLSVNEFVFTADAVRGAGDGDIDKGAERLQGIMKQLEQQGRPEGMGMLDVSERLSEVV